MRGGWLALGACGLLAGVSGCDGGSASTAESTPGSVICPPATQVAAAVGVPVQDVTTTGTSGPGLIDVSCRYRHPGQAADAAGWLVTVRRYGSVPAATAGFAAARRARISTEAPLPSSWHLGDEAATGRSLRDVLLVRRNVDVVVVEGSARPNSTLADLAAVYTLVDTRLGTRPR